MGAVVTAQVQIPCNHNGLQHVGWQSQREEVGEVSGEGRNVC